MKRSFICAYLIIFSAFLCAFMFTPPGLWSEPGDKFHEADKNEDLKHAPSPADDTPADEPIRVLSGGQTLVIDLEELLAGVVAAEMPAEYPIEALKAQTVAARSYILFKKGSQNVLHPGVDICADPAHCLAWLDDAALRAKWGSDYEKYHDKIISAVNQTAGQYLSYESKPINAVFFAISSGATEAVGDIWGGDLPYLAAVSSEGDRNAPGYSTEVTMTAAGLKSALSSRYPDAALPDDLTKCFESLTRSA